MTKKEIIARITEFLTNHPDKEINVQYFSKLRNGRWGFHPYTLCAMDNVVDGWVLYVRPWAGAKMCWRAKLENLLKNELEYILDKCVVA